MSKIVFLQRVRLHWALFLLWIDGFSAWSEGCTNNFPVWAGGSPSDSSTRFYALEFIFLGWNICMDWDIEYTDEFGAWWELLGAKEQVSVSASVDL